MLYHDRITEKTFSENCNRRKSLREAAIAGVAQFGAAPWGLAARVPARLLASHPQKPPWLALL